MRRCLPILSLVLIWSGPLHANGLLIPEERNVPPLAMLSHQVNIAIEDQVAVTRVEQIFRNHTDRALEATYLFPVPKGASVRKFSMWVNGSEVRGELVEADKARKIYTDIVRRTQDPGLLEYIGTNILRMRVFPIAARSDQKVALSYTAVAPRDAEVVEYVYPLKTDGKAVSTLEKFSVKATIKGQNPIQNVYSPTHAITLNRTNDREVHVAFEREQALLDKDFQLFVSMSAKDVGLTALTHRPIRDENGYYMLLISPRVEMPKDYVVPRDMVLVLDTSGSMRGPKMQQARKAMQYCLNNLNPQDRFGLINFATTINHYADKLLGATTDQLSAARKWVDNLESTGGTAIDEALSAALAMRSDDTSRTFTIVFFTDGQPTIGEQNPERILQNVRSKNTANTRIFTFGVGDDVNATMLDQIADQTRALSTYVRPAEDIESKVSSLYSKISHPVLASLKLSSSEAVKLSESYPPQLPDLFHGGQLVVLGRFQGKGHAALKLTGSVGKEQKEFVYEIEFPDKTGDDRTFVEDLWARRKVGYLLDQIRVNGAKKELVDETVALAKKYGIATPYTSYLIVPDGAVPVVGGMMGRPALGAGGMSGGGAGAPEALTGPRGAATVNAFAQRIHDGKKDAAAKARSAIDDESMKKRLAEAGDRGKEVLKEAQDKKATLEAANDALAQRDAQKVQSGKLGVEWSMQNNDRRYQLRLEPTAQRLAYGRNCLDVGGIWIDENYDKKLPTVIVKAQSDAYFRMLERQPKLKDVFRLGNHLVWVTPNGTALVIDTKEGKSSLSDAEIDKLFVAKK